MKHKATIAVAVALAGLGALVIWRLSGDGPAGKRGGKRGPAPVEVAQVTRGSIELRRTFTGTLEARERQVVAADVRGRVGRLLVDLGDEVQKGQVIAELDDDEEVQGVRQADAELAVARAEIDSARSALDLAAGELQRVEGLRARGIVSQAELDAARATRLARESALRVAEARMQRSQAGLQRARIQTGYAQVSALWTGDDQVRVVAERHVNEGERVAANQPLISVVDLEPITAVVFVTERDYGFLAREQAATITTDAFPGQEFAGVVRRIAPVFHESSRQARVEIELANPEHRLKPGMFVRAQVVLDRLDDATIVPSAALTQRNGQTGVFLVLEGEGQGQGQDKGKGKDKDKDKDKGQDKGKDKGKDKAGATVRWRPVEVGIREGERVAVTGQDITGQVVTLGQQLIDDGAAVIVPRAREAGPVEGAARERPGQPKKSAESP